MTYASYERQHLAVYAAGFINAAGTTRQSFGCELTRVSTGVFAAVFGAGDGLVNDQSYTFVTLKGASSAPPISVNVEDTSNLVKTIFLQGTTQLHQSDLEIAIFRTVEPGA